MRWSQNKSRRSSGIALFAVCVLASLAAAARAEKTSDARDALYASYAGQLKELTAWCDEHQLAAQADFTRQWLPVRDPFRIYAFALPVSFAPPAGLVGNRETTEWWQRFAALRRQQAEALFELAQQALLAHRARVAYELVAETVRENPDHERARAILGYQKKGDEWQTEFAVARTKAGQVWNEKYGWIPATQLQRYEDGYRFNNGRWITTEEDARLHRDIRNGWRIETEHYAVTTNAGLEEGVQLSHRLERLYEIWRQVFPTYATNEAELNKLFQNPSSGRRPRKPMEVVYFRDRDDYNQWFAKDQPQIAKTLGIYLYDRRCAYFFAGQDQDPTTLDHEATHQLFWETRLAAPDVGVKSNFWAVEGVACYMESLRARDGYFTLGGVDQGTERETTERLANAQYRLLVDKFYLPLAEFTALGREAMQRDPSVVQLYSQAAGMTWFLMSADAGRYRDKFTEYLSAIYTAKADAGTLAKLTGKSYDTLDREYREFMKQSVTGAR